MFGNILYNFTTPPAVFQSRACHTGKYKNGGPLYFYEWNELEKNTSEEHRLYDLYSTFYNLILSM